MTGAVGAVMVLAPSVAVATPWGENGKIAFDSWGRIYTVEPDGSELTRIVRGPADERYDWWPAWSPDGAQMVTSSRVLEPPNDWGYRYWSDTELEVFSLDGSASMWFQTPKQHSSGYAAWSPDGSRIAYATDWLGGPSIRSIQPDGQGDRMVLSSTTQAGHSEPAWSPDGSRIAFVSTAGTLGETDLFTMRADGTDVRKLLTRPGIDLSPSWSPDGQTIVFAGTGPRQGTDVSYWWPDQNIYVVPSAGGEPTKLTAGGTDDDPVWSPEGDMIAFESRRNPPPGDSSTDVYVMDADGSSETRITTIGCSQCGVDWQPLPTDEPRPAWSFPELPKPDPPSSDRPGSPQGQRRPDPEGGPKPVTGTPRPAAAIKIRRFAVLPRSFRWRDGGHVKVGLRAPGSRRIRFAITRVGASQPPCSTPSNPCRIVGSTVRRLKPGRTVIPVQDLVPTALKAGTYRLTAVAASGRLYASTTFRVRSRK